MAKIAFFDCFSGCSGDMIIGALLDAGLDFEAFKNSLSGLDLHGYHLTVEKVLRFSITATKFNVVLEEGPDHHNNHKDSHQHRDLTEILADLDSGKIRKDEFFAHAHEIIAEKLGKEVLAKV